jgi:hypothetical protein
VSATDGTYPDKVTITWDAAADATEYEIWRDTDAGGAAMALIGTTSALTYDDTSVTGLQVYHYWVKACSVSGCSAVSTPDSGYSEPPIPADPPANVSATDGTYSDKVTVTWDAAADATEYEVWRDTDAGGASMALIGTTGSLTYEDTPVTALQVYHYWVKACTVSGCSAVSTPDSGYAEPVIPAGPPANVTATDGTYTDKVTITWDAAADATEYEVWRDTDAGGAAMALIGTTSSLTYDDTSVVDLQVYHYWVKACSVSGCSTVSTPDSGYAESGVGGLLFWDDFETGDFSLWTRFNDGRGWLYPCASGAINGSWGACLERGDNDRRKQLIDETPVYQTSFATRFNFDINGLSMLEGERFRFMQVKMGAERPFFIVLV